MKSPMGHFQPEVQIPCTVQCSWALQVPSAPSVNTHDAFPELGSICYLETFSSSSGLGLLLFVVFSFQDRCSLIPTSQMWPFSRDLLTFPESFLSWKPDAVAHEEDSWCGLSCVWGPVTFSWMQHTAGCAPQLHSILCCSASAWCICAGYSVPVWSASFVWALYLICGLRETHGSHWRVTAFTSDASTVALPVISI